MWKYQPLLQTYLLCDWMIRNCLHFILKISPVLVSIKFRVQTVVVPKWPGRRHQQLILSSPGYVTLLSLILCSITKNRMEYDVVSSSEKTKGSLLDSPMNGFIGFRATKIKQSRMLETIQEHIQNIRRDPRKMFRKHRTSPTVKLFHRTYIHKSLESIIRRNFCKTESNIWILNWYTKFGQPH